MKEAKTLILIVGSLACFLASAQDNQDRYDSDCMPLRIENKHGPYNYRTATKGEKDLVERAHFNEHFEAYRLGKVKFQKKYDRNIETPAAGFGYTLWAFPNHYRALVAIEDLSFRQKSDKLDGLPLRVHCYFQRAVKFVPEDGLSRALYGYYYARRKSASEAEQQLAKAIEYQADDVNVLNYVATAYLEVGNTDQAVENAKKAYALGYPFPGLRNRIEKAGGKFD